MRAILFAILLGILLPGSVSDARAQESPFAVRIGNLWGATEAELVAQLRDRLDRLPMRWDFGPYYADYQLTGIGIAGEPFAAYLQMDRKTQRLGQILLERRQDEVTPESVRRVVEGMMGSLGKPDRQRIGGNPERPESTEFVWLRGDTMITLRLFDFRTTGLLGRTPDWERDPGAPFSETRRNNPHFLPRRLVIRFTPTEGTGSGRPD